MRSTKKSFMAACPISASEACPDEGAHRHGARLFQDLLHDRMAVGYLAAVIVDLLPDPGPSELGDQRQYVLQYGALEAVTGSSSASKRWWSSSAGAGTPDRGVQTLSPLRLITPDGAFYGSSMPAAGNDVYPGGGIFHQRRRGRHGSGKLFSGRPGRIYEVILAASMDDLRRPWKGYAWL